MTTPPSIPRRCLCGLLIALFAAGLVWPVFQQFSGIPAELHLSGIQTRTREFPPLSLQTWLNGRFAAAADAWVREHAGMRGWLTVLDRQIRYSLFGQLETAPLRKRAVVIGRPPVLFENIVLTDALRPPQVSPEKMVAFGARLARTRDLLREQGKAFLVVLAPNKALVYPEHLPGWARRRVSDDNTDYLPFIETLRRNQIPFLDSIALLRELKPQHPDLVPYHATHWSNHATWIVWQRAIPLINAQGLLPEIPVPVTERLAIDKATSMNDELRFQLNLFFGPHARPLPSAYPVAAPPPPGVDPMLDVLLVGDSFGLTLMDAMARSQLCNSIQLWFYLLRGKEPIPLRLDSREMRCLQHIRGIPLEGSNNEKLLRMLAGKNLVVFVVTTFNIDKLSWNFDRLVIRVFGDPAETAEPVEEVAVDLDD